MEKTTIRMCPFCGHHGQELEEFTFGDNHGCSSQMWRVHCHCCGARGPAELEKRFAIESWNHIYKNPAHEDDTLMVDFEYD